MKTGLRPYTSDGAQRIETEGQDAFGHRDYADAIVAAIGGIPTPFTLGLFGPWGSGKSTILEEVGRRLREESSGKTVFSTFDAWRYEGDSLRREFIRKIASDLAASGALPESFDLTHHLQRFDTDLATVQETGLKVNEAAVKQASIAAILVLAALAVAAFLPPVLGVSDATTVKAVLAVLGSVVAFALVALHRVVAPVAVQQTQHAFQYPDQFAENFRDLLRNAEADSLVIGIDNLDRCAPERVAEILGTIKTFLEPALGEGGAGEGVQSLAFVIAADDEALRRHLTAQELSQGPVAPGLAPAEDGVPPEVRIAVDEYLRKFFNASLRITEILDEDIRDYTRKQLEGFFAAHDEIDKVMADQLVEITAQGLKRNPRRIKQFVNNLELRVQLLSDRRRAERIQLDPNVLVVAKLAILEEEFPGRFGDLLDDPGRLVQWHTEAASTDDGSSTLDERLASFLRFTDHVQPSDIRAYLTLKQTSDERTVPGFQEFIELLDDGDVEGLRAFLKEADQEMYVTAMTRHFDRQLVSRSWSRAHNAVRSVIEVSALRGTDGVVLKRVLDEVLSHPALRERLPQQDPKALLLVSIAYLSPSLRERIVSEMVSAFASSEESSVRRKMAEALAEFPDELHEAARQELYDAFESDAIRRDFRAYASLAEAIPEAIPDDVARDALTALDHDEVGILEDAQVKVASDNPAFRVAVAMLQEPHADPALVERLLRVGGRALRAHREDSNAEFGKIAQAIGRVVEGGPKVEGVSELTSDLVAGWSELEPEARRDALWLGLALGGSGRAIDPEVSVELVERAFELGGQIDALDWIREYVSSMPSEAKQSVLEMLAARFADTESEVERNRLGAFAAGLGPADGKLLLAKATELALAAGRDRVAGALVSQMGPKDASVVVTGIAKELIGKPETLEESLAGARFVVDKQDLLADDDLTEFARLLVSVPYENREMALRLAPLIGGLRVGQATTRLELVEQLIATERDMSYVDRRVAMLEAAGSMAGLGRSRARTAVAVRIEELGSSQNPVDREVADAFRVE